MASSPMLQSQTTVFSGVVEFSSAIFRTRAARLPEISTRIFNAEASRAPLRVLVIFLIQ